MSDLGREIASEVPYLRRFARAAVGDQSHGDGCVRQCLETLLRDPSSVAEDGVRLAAFRILCDVLERALAAAEEPLGAGGETVGDRSILARRITDLEPLGRRLLLLTTLEGMSLGQAAHVLRLEPARAAALLDAAKRALYEQKSTRILIIEDEPVIALDIAAIVQRNGHTIVGIATTHREAVEIARAKQPGLVLADIQLADRSSGLEAVREILGEISVPVVFITAYPERLLTGERPEPTFLITKPFDPDTLAVSIAQALATARSHENR
jgi:CheY-like chemotaxis protein/DNA-directed RNA polymerase specialized sigma24 family protein